MLKSTLQTNFTKDLADNARGLAEDLEGSLDLIPSPSLSVKIQIIGGKVYMG